jgi:two-component system sensor histidine kinase SenX3
MGRNLRVPMFAIAGALLGLILLLATLQYKWLGQISGAERERMTANLNTRATAFAKDFDREVTRAYLLFQMDPMLPDASSASSFVARYDGWQATARFPRMIKDVYLVPAPEADGQPAPPQRFNPSTRFLEPAEWPAALSQIRTELSRRVPLPAGTPASAAAGTQTIVMRSMIAAVWPSAPALVIPTPLVMLTHVAGSAPTVQMAPAVRYIVLLLDADYIKGEMLPGLAQTHFQGTGDGFDYQLAVVPTASKDPIYRSVADFAPAAEAPVDAKVDLFQVRTKDFEPLVNEVTRFATFTSMTHIGPGRGQTFVRETVGSPAGHIAIGTAPRSFIIQKGSAATGQARIEASVSRAAAKVALGAHLNNAAAPHWRLLVKHPSGSLEQAVNAVRRRNLIISTSILGILGVSVGFLVLSTRRAQDLARQQLEFVATVSHELRTPLAVIRSAADNLADGVVNDEARIRQYGQLVRREGLRLTDLVEQILEFAGLQSAQRTMARHPVEISGLVRDVTAAAESVAQPAGVAIELDVADNLPPVAGDEAALRRVFQNLIGNAIKYGAEARWIRVSARASGGHVDVSVTDRGIGIAAAEQGKIFDPFYRAPDVVAAQIQGAGLGLSLVKRIVEAHAGHVTLKSAPGAGSTFTVTLPVLKGDASPKVTGDVSQASALPSQ